MPDKYPFSRKQEAALILLVLMVAAVLRLGWPGVTQFEADEARLLARALDIAQGQQFHIRGISSSIGFPNTAWSVWFYALPLLLWQHAISATLFTGLVNLLAVAGGWWIARRYWGAPAALAALLMFAVSPWAVLHARKIWAQNLLPPLAVGWAVGALLAYVERRPRFIILHLFCLAVAVQVHFAALALVPATFFFFLFFRRRLEVSRVVIGLGLSLLTVLPFLYYLLFQSEANLGVLLNAGESSNSGFQPVIWRHLWLLVVGGDIHSLAGPERFQDYLAGLPPLWPLSLVWGGLLAAGVFWMGGQVRRREDKASEAALIVLVWLLAPALFFSWFPVPVFIHYLLAVYPAPYVAAGAGFAWLVTLLRRRSLRRLAWLVLLFTALLQIWSLVALHQLLAHSATPGGFGTPLAYKLEAVRVAREQLARTGAAEILIASAGENPAVDSAPAVYGVLLRGVPHRSVNVSRSAVFPREGAVVLLADVEPEMGAAPLYLEQAQEVVRLPLREWEGAVHILNITGSSAPSVFLEEPVLFGNGVQLYGYDPLQLTGDGFFHWRLYWHPAAHPEPADYHFFNQLLDAEGEQIGQEDAAVFAPWQWQAGDTVVSHFTLSPSGPVASPLTMRVGMYEYPSLSNISILDVMLNPAGEFVLLPAD